jgi:restriction endonuclease S subunit
VTGDWRKLRNEELHDLYCSQNVIYNDHIEKNEIGRTRGMRTGHLDDIDKHEEDNINTDLRETEREGADGFIWLRIETSAGCCEHGNELEPSHSARAALAHASPG